VITAVLPLARQKFLRYFEEYLGFFSASKSFHSFIYLTSSRGTSDDVLSNLAWETLHRALSVAAWDTRI